MCVIDLDQCTCDCHSMEGVAHVMPCCMVCPECGATVTYGAFEAHERAHSERHEVNTKLLRVQQRISRALEQRGSALPRDVIREELEKVRTEDPEWFGRTYGRENIGGRRDG